MWLVLIVLLECALLWLFVKWTVSFYGAVFCFFVYALFYMDKSERTGRRSFDRLRELWLWAWLSGTKHSFYNEVSFENEKRGCLILVAPCLTPLAMIWGFGFHGNRVMAKKEILWACPRALFRIPLLRDVLLWSGAVSDNLTDVIALVNRNYTVAMSPSGLRDAADSDGTSFYGISREIASFCVHNMVNVHPAWIDGQYGRYAFSGGEQVRSLQRKSLRAFGYPFPMLCCCRCSEKLMASVGAPCVPKRLDGHSMETDTKAFIAKVKSGWMTLTTTDNPLSGISYTIKDPEAQLCANGIV